MSTDGGSSSKFPADVAAEVWQNNSRMLRQRCEEGVGLTKEDLLSALDAMNDAFYDVYGEYHSAKTKFGNMEETISKLKTELQESEDTLSTMQMEHLTAQDQLEQERKDLNERLQAQTRQMAEREKEYEAEREKLLEMIERSQRVSSELDDALNRTNTEKTMESSTLQKVYEEREEALQAAFEERERSLQDEVKRLRGEMDRTSRALDQKDTLLGDTRSELLAELRRVRDLMHEKDRTAQQEKKALEMEYERCRRFVQDRQKLLEENKRTMSLEMELTVADLRDQLTRRSEEIEELKDELRRIREESGTEKNNVVAGLMSELKVVKEQSVRQEDHQQLIMKERDVLQAELERRAKIIEQREQQLEDRERERQRLREHDLGELRERAAELEAEKKIVMSQVQELRRLVEDSEKKLYEGVDRVDRLYTDVIRSSADLSEQWKLQRADLEQYRQQRCREMDQIENERQSERQSHAGELERLERLVSERDNRLSGFEQVIRENDAFRQEVNKLQCIAEERRSDIDKLQEELSAKNDRYSQSLCEAVQLMEEVRKEKHDQAQRYEQQLRSLHTVSDEMQRRLTSGLHDLESFHTRAEEDLAKWKERAEAAEKQRHEVEETLVSQFSDRIRTLEQVNMTLSSQLTNAEDMLTQSEITHSAELKLLTEQLEQARRSESYLKEQLTESRETFAASEEALKAQMIHWQTRSSELSHSVESMKSELSDLREENRRNVLRPLRQELEGRTIEGVEACRKELESECARLREELASQRNSFEMERKLMNDELIELRNARNDLNRDHQLNMEIVEKENKRLQTEISALRQRFKDTEAVLCRKESELNAATDVVMAAKERLLKLEVEKETFLNTERSQLMDRIDAERKALAAREDSLLKQLEAVNVQNKHLKEEHQRQRDLVEQQGSVLSKQMKKLDELMNKRTELVRREIQTQSKSLEIAQKARTDLEQSYKKQIRDLKQELNSLRTSANSRHKLFADEKRALKSEVERLLGQDGVIREDVEKQAKKKWAKQRKALEQQVQEAAEECKRLRYTIVRLQNQEADREKTASEDIQQLQDALLILRKMEEERVQQYQVEKRATNDLISKLSEQLNVSLSTPRSNGPSQTPLRSLSSVRNASSSSVRSSSGTPKGF